MLNYEEAVIGSILRYPKTFDDVFAIIPKADRFQDTRMRSLYQGMINLTNNNQPIDIITVAALTGEKTVDLSERAGTSPEHYACEIARAYRLLALRSGLSSIAADETSTVDEMMNRAEAVLMDATGQVEDDVVSVAGFGPGYIKESLKTGPSEHFWIGTRVAALDKKITGLYRGEMVIVAAPPSMGKTIFGVDFCLFNAPKHNSLYVSLDQTKGSIIDRIIAGTHGISKAQLRSGRMNDEQYNYAVDAGEGLKKFPGMFILDRGGVTVMDIRSRARRIKRRHGLDILVIDYVQQIPFHGKVGSRTLELAEISRCLKEIAKELDLVLVVLSQLNREYARVKINPGLDQWGLPTQTQLRDSGALEQDANVILFPWVPMEVLKKHPDFGEQSMVYKRLVTGYYDDEVWVPPTRDELQTLTYMVVGKNKDGETGVVECHRDVKRMRFYSEAQEERSGQ